MTDRDGEDQAFVDAISEWPDIDDGPTLAGFLLARITEDERAVRYASVNTRRPTLSLDCDGYPVMDLHRVLAECEAKRRIVGLWDLRMSEPDPGLGFEPAPLGGQGAEVYYDAIRLLALPYADHPDYRPEWRP